MPTKSTKRAALLSTATPVTDKPVSAKAAKRNVSVSGAKPTKPETTKPDTAPVPAIVAANPATDAAPMPRGLTRDAAGIVRYATFFNQYSDRDSAYLAFFGTVARANNGTATLRQIHDAGSTRGGDATSRKRYNPNYTGSGKATDVGAVNRLCKAGYFTRSADGNTLTATPRATASAIYLGSKQA